MQSVKDLIAMVLREVDEALQENKSLSTGDFLEPEHINIRFDFSPQYKKADNPTVELRLAVRKRQSSESSTQPANPPSFSSQKAGSLAGPEAEQATGKLAQIFGNPGFDSSARAAVFVEAMATFPAERIPDVLNAVANPATRLEDQTLVYARHSITNAFKSGPMRSAEQAAALFMELLGSYSLGSLIYLLKSKWKSEAGWL